MKETSSKEQIEAWPEQPEEEIKVSTNPYNQDIQGLSVIDEIIEEEFKATISVEDPSVIDDANTTPNKEHIQQAKRATSKNTTEADKLRYKLVKKKPERKRDSLNTSYYSDASTCYYNHTLNNY